LNDGSVCVLLVLNAAGIFKFGKLGGSLFEHLLLDDSALFTITLIDLLQDISLVILLCNRIAHLSLFSFSLCASDLFLNELLLIL